LVQIGGTATLLPGRCVSSSWQTSVQSIFASFCADFFNCIVPNDGHYCPVKIDRLQIEAPPSLGNGDAAKFLYSGEYSRIYFAFLHILGLSFGGLVAERREDLDFLRLAIPFALSTRKVPKHPHVFLFYLFWL